MKQGILYAVLTVVILLTLLFIIGERSFTPATNETLSHILPTTQTAAVADFNSSLIAHYTFDGDTNDSAGSNTGTASGGPTYTTGRIGQAIQFDGVDDAVDVESGAALDNLSALTYSAWVKINSLSGNKVILDKGGRSVFRINNNTGALMYSVEYSTGPLNRSSAGNVVPVGEWVHIVLTWDGSGSVSGVHIYVNGSEVSYNGAGTDAVGTREGDGAYNQFIGNYIYGGMPMNGSMDDVRIYNRVLTAQEIAELYAYTGDTGGGTGTPPPPPPPPDPTPTTYTLTVSKSGTGSGTITGSSISCGNTCSQSNITSGTQVTLTASPSGSDTFTGWSGGGCSGTGACTVTVSANTTVTATLTTPLVTPAGACAPTNIRCVGPGQEYATIQACANAAVAGDTCRIAAGTYNEFVSVSRSGTSGSPITFEGTRDANGEYLTIIDPSADVSTGWESAGVADGFNSADGVYKKAIAFDPWQMTIDNKAILKVRTTGDMSQSIFRAYGAGTNIATGKDVLAISSNYTVMPATGGTGGTRVPFWDGVEALYGYLGGTAYIRFRNGEDPDTKNITIRAASNNNTSLGSAVTLAGSYNILRNVKVRGAYVSVLMTGAGSHHNVVENNYLSNGWARVAIYDGASNNIIRNNEITLDYYGTANTTPPGPWGGGRDTISVRNQNIYSVSKFLSGDEQVNDHGVRIQRAGPNNEIANNHIFNGVGEGILFAGSPDSPVSGTDVHDNTIHNTPSVGLMFWEGHTGTKVHHNLVYEHDINMRLHHMNYAGKTDRKVYVYNNRFWLSQRVGEHMYCHFYGGGASYYPEFWIYHNSFSGGVAGLECSNGTVGLPGVRFLNNIFSNMGQYYLTYSLPFATTKSLMGAFDYNVVTMPLPTYPITTDPVWFGSYNIKSDVPVWSGSVMPSFQLSSGSSAIDAGINIASAFNMDGTNYAALPGFSPSYFRGAKPDIGAYEYNNGQAYTPPQTPQPLASPSADFNHDGAVNTLDFSLMVSAWNTTSSIYDLNHDSTVNTLDYSIMAGQWTG